MIKITWRFSTWGFFQLKFYGHQKQNVFQSWFEGLKSETPRLLSSLELIIECAKLRVSRVFVPYVLRVPTCLTCSRALRACVPSFFFFLLAFLFLHTSRDFIFYMPYMPSFFKYLMCMTWAINKLNIFE